MRSAERGRGGRFRLTIRARITLSVALLIALGGGVLVVGLNVFMRFGPVWAIQSFPTLPAGADELTGVTGVAVPSDALIPADAAAAEAADPFSGGTEYLGDATAFDAVHGNTASFSLLAPVLEIRDVTDVLSTLLWSSAIALVVIVVLGAVAAWILAGRVLSPLHDINAAARAAAPGQLDRRVALRGPRDELTDLSDTLDDMLDRLERAFRAQQLFAANASHELRTPLATQKAILDVLLDGPEPTPDEYRIAAERIREVNARSIEMGEALLELTRAQLGIAAAPSGDDGGRAPGEHGAFESCDATELIASALGHAEARIADRDIAIETDIAAHSVRVHPALFARLLDNLVGNAARHATRGGRLSLTWRVDGTASVLRVCNTAEPLPPETLEKLQQPFVRGGGRVRAESGSGLGLAIADAVAQAHGGTLHLASREHGGPGGGSVFSVEVRIPIEGPLATLAA